MITYEDFSKLDLRIGKIVAAERVEKSEKLLKLQVDLGINEETQNPETRQIIAGLGKAYDPENLIGKEIVIIANLEPKMLLGLESRGMLLAAADDKPVLLIPDSQVPPGSKIS